MDTRTLALLLAPVLLIELTMKVLALVNLRRQERTRGPKWMWALLILFTTAIGWIGYFAVGRDET